MMKSKCPYCGKVFKRIKRHEKKSICGKIQKKITATEWKSMSFIEQREQIVRVKTNFERRERERSERMRNIVETLTEPVTENKESQHVIDIVVGHKHDDESILINTESSEEHTLEDYTCTCRGTNEDCSKCGGSGVVHNYSDSLEAKHSSKELNTDFTQQKHENNRIVSLSDIQFKIPHQRHIKNRSNEKNLDQPYRDDLGYNRSENGKIGSMPSFDSYDEDSTA